MKRLKYLLLTGAFLSCMPALEAINLEVWTLNNKTKVLKVVNKATNEEYKAEEESGSERHLTIDPGTYIFSLYDEDGTTFLGSIEQTFEDNGKDQNIKLYTGTIRISNTNDDGSPWVEGEDYTLSYTLTQQKGGALTYTPGRTSAGLVSLVATQSDVLKGTATPTQKHLDEDYLEYSSTTNFLNNKTLTLTMSKAVVTNFTVPEDAELQIGSKPAHFVDFKLLSPFKQESKDGKKTLSYKMQPGSTYNYRTWREGELTRAGYFSSAKDTSSEKSFEISEQDYKAFDPKEYNQDVKSNSGYETGDILVNGNEQGYVSLATGETFQAHAMRSWQLTDTSTNNYFFEPDFHYTVTDLDGKPLEGVIEITQKPGSAWADIKAIAPGTAIVTVTYDAIGVNYFNSKDERNAILGGEIWGAIWPENTAVYVVSVAQGESSVVPNMTVNEEYNLDTLKVAGKNVDAEHDVFYYLDTEEGFEFTFSPENVQSISIAYPEIGEQMASYSGFTSEGVKKNEDDSWTLLLKHGRQIVCMTDASGNSTYQVMRARKCHREITNVTNPGSSIFQPGEQIKIQYSGLFHPANKLAGIYNMSAYVTYNGVPNGTDLILGAGQYTFGSVPAAQAVTISIPADMDLTAGDKIELTEGVIQVNGYGDPIGNHRIIDPEKGRNANFAAIAHKTYFGSIPDVSVKVSEYKSFKVALKPNVEDAEISVVFRGNQLTADEDGFYTGTYGTYEVEALKAGYYCYREQFNIADDAEGDQTFNINMLEAPENAWDGKTMTRPETVAGAYNITNGAELAWFANEVNSGNSNNAILGADIDLAGYAWTPIGTAQANPFKSVFDGKFHTIKNLYINESATQYRGLFGFVAGVGLVSSLNLEGTVIGGQYSGTIAGKVADQAVVDRCANFANLKGGSYSGAMVGYLYYSGKLTNSYNAGSITCSTNAGGLAGMIFSASVENCYNIGQINCSTNAGALTGRFTGSTASNIFVDKDYDLIDDYYVATADQFASGEIAYRLGEAFGQQIGEDAYPVINGMKVFKVEYSLIPQEDAALYAENEEEGEEETETLPCIYTNGSLPETIEGEEAHWFADADMTQPIETVSGDASLYLKLGKINSINSIESGKDINARWFNSQGLEIAAPAKGTHGVFIRVVGGHSEKVVL